MARLGLNLVNNLFGKHAILPTPEKRVDLAQKAQATGGGFGAVRVTIMGVRIFVAHGGTQVIFSKAPARAIARRELVNL